MNNFFQKRKKIDIGSNKNNFLMNKIWGLPANAPAHLPSGGGKQKYISGI